MAVLAHAAKFYVLKRLSVIVLVELEVIKIIVLKKYIEVAVFILDILSEYQ